MRRDDAVPPDGLGASRRHEPMVSVVMPAYNEAANLPATLGLVRAALRRLSEHWEILVVDDGSVDATPALMQAPPDGVRCLRLSRNFGKEAALTAGLARARGEVVVLMDADGQHPVELLPAMLQCWREGADTVCAVREDRADESWLKRVGTRCFYRLVNAGAAVRIPADVGDYRLMDRRVVDALNALPERTRFMKGLYAWVGFATVTLPYTPLPRRQGHSRFSSLRLARLALTGITAFTTLPLRLWSAVGGGVALLALAYGVWIVIEHLVQGHPVPGWPTLVAGMMFFSGVQLLSIGVLGEYVGRIFDEVKQRPVYLVSQDSGAASSVGQAVGQAVGLPAGGAAGHAAGPSAVPGEPMAGWPTATTLAWTEPRAR